MESLHGSMHACFCAFMFMKAQVFIYLLHLVLPFTPHYIIKVQGPFSVTYFLQGLLSLQSGLGSEPEVHVP